MTIPSFVVEASRASEYGPSRFNADERRLLASAKAYIDQIDPNTVITTQGDLIIGDAVGVPSRLARGSANSVLVADASTLSYSQVTNSHISNSAAIAYSKLALAGAIVNADISASAAIAYSKLALTGTVVNADISNSAAIAYSKLALTGSLVNADLSDSAAIAFSKLAALPSAQILVGNGSNVATAVAVTGDVTLSNAGVTAIAPNIIDANDLSLGFSALRCNFVTVNYTDLNAAGSGVNAFFGGSIPDNAWNVFTWYRVRTQFTGNGNSGSVMRLGIGDNSRLKVEAGLTSGIWNAGSFAGQITNNPSTYEQNDGAQQITARWTAAGTDSALTAGALDAYVFWVPGV